MSKLKPEVPSYLFNLLWISMPFLIPILYFFIKNFFFRITYIKYLFFQRNSFYFCFLFQKFLYFSVLNLFFHFSFCFFSFSFLSLKTSVFIFNHSSCLMTAIYSTRKSGYTALVKFHCIFNIVIQYCFLKIDYTFHLDSLYST